MPVYFQIRSVMCEAGNEDASDVLTLEPKNHHALQAT